MATSSEITLQNGVLSFAGLRASAKTDAQVWWLEKLWRVPLILEQGGKQTTLWIRRKALIQRWKVTPQQITAAQQQGGIAALAQTLKDLDTRRISTLLQNNTLKFPDRLKAAETLSSALREARKTQTDIFLSPTDVLPYGAYVNRDGSVYFKTHKIAPCIMGEVWECQKLGSSDSVVVKDVKVDCFSSQPYRELSNLRKLQRGPNIVPLITSSLFSQGGYPRMALFMPKYEGSLNQLKNRLTPKQKEIVAKKILQTLSYLAAKGIHRDFTLKNILINTQTLEIRFIDFGTFVFHGEDESLYEDRTGTRAYFSPEYAAAPPSRIRSATTPKLDVWACGVALLELFGICDLREEEKPVGRDNGWLFTLKRNLAELPLAFLKLIHQMTQVRPEERCTAYKAHFMIAPRQRIYPSQLPFPWKHGYLLPG